MAAQYAVELRAQSLYSTAALVIEKMSAEFDRDAVQGLKGMTEKEKLALGVELRPLHALPIPGSTDLETAMARLDIHDIAGLVRYAIRAGIASSEV